MSVNKVILVGNAGADPEVRTTGSGVVICSLRLATNERRKDDAGNWVDHTEWHRVTAFGTTAENLGRYVRKGRQVYVEGKIRTRKYQDKDGVDRYATEIIADQVVFLGAPPGDGDRDASPRQDRPRDRPSTGRAVESDDVDWG